MNINGINGTTSSQLYQLPAQKSGGQVVQQPQPAPAQGTAEETKESASEKNKESSQGTESMESRSINLYA